MATIHTQVGIDIEVPRYSDKTLSAMAEARRISRDPDIKGYTNMDELKATLDDDVSSLIPTFSNRIP